MILRYIAALCAATIMTAGISACKYDGSVRQVDAPIIYGSDDRKEYFDAVDPNLKARISESMVALIPKTMAQSVNGQVVIKPSLPGETSSLCSEERFSDQTDAAFCAGVLVDWDLVLTAGHCVRLFALDDFWVVFGYYYQKPEEMRLCPNDVIEPLEIVSEALSPMGDEPRQDYAWIRLTYAPSSSRKPAPIYVKKPDLNIDDPIIAVSTVGGSPMKHDDGGHIQNLREPFYDYFIADADTSKGSSGGAAFDQNLTLVGILARGGNDLIRTQEGCDKVIRQEDRASAEEQFTYSYRAVEGLCSENGEKSSICREDCGPYCQALPPETRDMGAGCEIAGYGPRPARPVCFLYTNLFIFLVIALRFIQCGMVNP